MFPQKLYLTKSTEFVSKFASHIIAVSEFTKKDLIDHGWGATDDRITVVHEGVDSKHFYKRKKSEVEKIKRKYSIKGDYIFFLSTIQPRKNVPGLVEAFSMVRNQISENRDLTLVLAGKPGWHTEESYEAPKKFGVEKYVKFLDHVPLSDLPALFSGSLFHVLPSFVEGFGLSALQSMSCGTPVVVSNVGAIREVVEETGLYFDPHDVSDMTKKMFRMWKDESLRKKLSKEGLIRAKLFTWREAAKEMIKVFEKVI